MNKKYKMIGILGKSGTGKNTVLDTALREIPDLHRLIDFTTRPPRKGEKDCKDYYFVDEYLFLDLVDNSHIVTYEQFANKWYYGLSYDEFKKDKINIGIINDKRALNLIKNPKIDLKIVYLTCDDNERLLRRLTRANPEPAEEIIRRMEAEKEEFKFALSRFTPTLVCCNEKPSDIPHIVSDIRQLAESF